MLVLLVNGGDIDQLTTAEVIAFLNHFQIGASSESQ